MLRHRSLLLHLHTYVMLRYRSRLLHLHTYLMLRYRPRLLHLHTYLLLRYRPRLLQLEHAVKVLRPEKNRKVRIFCCLPVAKRKSIKKQGILKQPLSTPGVHKSLQIQAKNDEKIKHNGISHILWPNMMMIASKVLQIPRDKHEGHHKDSWENAKTHAR